MKVLTLASSGRTLDNVRPVLDAMRARGDELHLAWVPLGAAFDEDPGLEATTHALLKGGSRPGDDGEYWARIGALLDDGFDLVLMDDMIHWPSARLRDCVVAAGRRIPLVAFQHGLYQAWQPMNAAFRADYFLCYGPRHVLNFDVCHWPKVLPVGLPKLDCIDPAPIAKPGACILFVAQSAPDPSILSALFADLEEATGLPVCIRPHPAHRTKYDALRGRHRFLDTGDILVQIRECSWMLTTHSTAVLQAMRMGRPAVLLPSFGLTDFRGYPGVSVDFIAGKVLAALKKHIADTDGREAFMRESCGGDRRDATRCALSMIDAITANAGEAPSKAGLHRLLGDRHPLNQVDALCRVASASPP